MACRQNIYKNDVHFPNSFPKSVICLASQESQVLMNLASIDGVSTKALVPAAINNIEVLYEFSVTIKSLSLLSTRANVIIGVICCTQQQ